MKLSKIGLIAAAAAVLLSPAFAFAQSAPKIDEKNHAKGKAEAPALVAASGTSCNLTDALFVLTSTDAKTKTKTDVYELACDGSMGRVLLKAVTGDQTKYQTFDCISTSAPYADGKPNQLLCKLPANQKPLTGLTPFITKAGVVCDPTKARTLGSTPDTTFFELACAGDRGYLLGVPVNYDLSKEVSASSCLAFEAGTAMECKLTTREAMLASVTTLAASADKACQVKDRRYILSSKTGDEYYEVSCASGSGFVVVADAKGAYKNKIECANADGIAGGCTLTDVKTAQTADNALYTRLAKAAGYDCAVSGYRAVSSTAQEETVELACSNRPDGAIAQFPKTGDARVFNCAAAWTTGYHCNLTKEDAAYAQLTAAVKKTRPTSTCQVSSSKFLGVNTDGGFVEVACADKEPGYVVRYLKTTAQPTDAFYCSQVKAQLGVSCALPTNITK